MGEVMTLCEPAHEWGINTHKSSDCSVFAECLPDVYTNITQYVCDCRASYDLLQNGDQIGSCEKSTSTWVLIALHSILALVSIPVSARLLFALRKGGRNRLELVHDAMWLSLLATVSLCLRSITAVVRLTVLGGVGEGALSIVLLVVNFALVFSFSLSVMIYGLVILEILKRSENLAPLGDRARQQVRRKVFGRALTFSALGCVCSGIPFSINLVVVGHGFICILGLMLVLIFATAHHQIRKLLSKYAGRANATTKLTTLNSIVRFVLLCVGMFATAAIVFTVSWAVGHKFDSKAVMRECQCFALLVEFASMLLFQLGMARAAEEVVGGSFGQLFRKPSMGNIGRSISLTSVNAKVLLVGHLKAVSQGEAARQQNPQPTCFVDKTVLDTSTEPATTDRSSSQTTLTTSHSQIYDSLQAPFTHDDEPPDEIQRSRRSLSSIVSLPAIRENESCGQNFL